jgi:hypothetical protein
MKWMRLASWRLFQEEDTISLFDTPLILIKGNHNDARCTYFQKKLITGSEIISVVFDNENFELKLHHEGKLNISNLVETDPVMKADLLINEVLQSELSVVLDMTSMSTEVLFILIKAFYDARYDDFTVVYVQPQDYIRNKNDKILPEFLLSKELDPISAIPGFLRLPDEDKQEKVLVFIGFEGGRFQELCEHILSDGKIDVIPILPMPSFKAGWHMLGIYLNLDTLKSNDILSNLKRVTAWDPFFALDVLEEQYLINDDTSQIIVAPLGTKPHTLASVLFAVKHESVRIMYDHPRVHDKRTEGIGPVRGYYLKGIFSYS